MKIILNQNAINDLRLEIANQLAKPINRAVQTAQLIVPVDTSSLQQSVRGGVEVNGTRVIGRVAAGGEDYSDTYFASTKQWGNYVDYAGEQEAIHGFLEAALGTLGRY